MIKKLLIATHNNAKLGELLMGVETLKNKGVEILSLNDLHVAEDPEETGMTFEENSVLKARFYGDLTGLPTIADDGGLRIDILGGEPGVKSKRWMGRDATDKELMAYALERLKDVPDEKRTAALQTTLTLYVPETGRTWSESEFIRGHIARKASGNPTDGYPYRALFIVREFGKYYDELTPGEHHRINHRLKALARLVKKIESDLLE